jgi:hypothetical protein
MGGYCYLVQPALLCQTNRYKIGMSSKADLSRLRSYHNGTRYILVFECDDARVVERKLLFAFNRMYTRCLGGNEYFECDNEMQMINLFVDIVMSHKNGVSSKYSTPKQDPIEYVESTSDCIDWMQQYRRQS